ncbi:tetratricopeptide repeat protein [Pseudomarimonas salicorniae]|uniref:Tetratricopeptide repeat protein n=1 Tax=Pseudomarimonas salicorniae TaxID=2933270 RepID=A0ABT0GDW4_9GAMM|nr:tetratricopeptide repeat protein [Lysobacter sp. CAU 1642]MCK7592732.1 tetratricopeptide repeat protein [Lysobacter sp. CAU 1642]
MNTAQRPVQAPKSGLWAELRRRNVIRMAGLYLVGAWLIVQVAETVLPIFHTPDWVLQTLIVLIALGFLPALVFSWLYELTPDGLKRDSEVPVDSAIASRTAKRLDMLTLAAVAVLLAVIAADRFWPSAGAPVRPPPVSTAAALAIKPTVPAQATTGAAPAGHTPGLIAVLPFRNRSVRPEDAFFAEGVHDDLLTQLSKVAAFRVISRTSMMRYTDTTKSVPEIAAELGAAVVLEGAVQRAGDQVRITVQLIDGASDVHVWAESYDRALTTDSIFAIQADIAQAVAKAMEVALSADESSSLRTGMTQNLDAYEAFLQGTLLSDSSTLSPETSRQAIAAFDRAIALDPDFAEAHARKAHVQLLSFWLALGPRALREAGRDSLAEARRLAPDNIETLLAQAYEYYWGQQDYARAQQTLDQILARLPDHAAALETSAYVARRDGRFDDAFDYFERALAINPQEVDVIHSLVELLFIIRGDFDAAEAMLQRAARLGADNRVRAIWIQEARGDLDAAWAEVDGPVQNFFPVPARIAIKSRDPARIAQALSPELWPHDQRSVGDFPELYAMVEAVAALALGQQEQARQLLQAIKARLEQRSDPYPSRWLGNAYYHPCDLPGMLGDLEGVRAAEADYLANARRDEWGSRGVHLSLAMAFSRAGDPERALHYLDRLIERYGPHTYAWFAPEPGFDSLREHPRFLAYQAAYQQWAAERRE